MVYQQFINYPNFTVYENIASPLRWRQVPKREIGDRVSAGRRPAAADADARAQAERALRRPAAAGGDRPRPGQGRRPRPARRAARQSRLQAARGAARRAAEAVRRAGDCTVVYATTEPVEALLLGGHTATLHEGRIVQYGPTSDVYRKPGRLLTAQVFSDPPINTAPRSSRAAIGSSWRTGWRWPCRQAGWRVPDGSYNRIRPHHIQPAGDQGSGRADRGPGAGHRALGLGKRDPFRSAAGTPGCPSRTACTGSRSARRAALCSMSATPCSSIRPATWSRAEGRDGDDHAGGSKNSGTATCPIRRPMPTGRSSGSTSNGGRRRLCPARAVRLRQDHAPQHHLRPAAAHRGPRPVRRRRRDRPAARPAQHRAGVPVPGHLRHDDRLRQSRLSAAQPRRRGGRGRHPGAGDRGACSTSTPTLKTARRA